MMNLHKILFVVVCLLLTPVAAMSQGASGSGIAGVVRDSSGGVLPGVTVETTSPALIEKARSAVTDDQGLYLIADLRPGTYAVTFSLPGFGTVRREGIELTAGFTATVNTELSVGTLEETITVTGAAPLVDVRNVVQRTTLVNDTLDALPITRNTNNLASLVPQVVAARSVGAGIEGETRATMGVNGGHYYEINVMQDGMNVTLLSIIVTSYNPYGLQEVGMETAARSAETYTSGVGLHLVQRDGGNIFSGSAGFTWGPTDLQAGNLSHELRDRGLFATPSLRKFYDGGGGMGGPIMRDKLWFFTAHRAWVASRYFAGNFYNKRHGTLFYEKDLSRPGYSTDYYRNHSLRLTGQASAKDRVSGHISIDDNCDCDIRGSGTVTPEANIDQHYRPGRRMVFTWNRPQTSRLLFEAGAAIVVNAIDTQRTKGVTESDISVIDQGLGVTYGSRAATSLPSHNCCYGIGFLGHLYNQRFAVSYITGSHAFKTGFTHELFTLRHKQHNNVDAINKGVQYTFRNQVPVSVRLFATPSGWTSDSTLIGAFVQDRWTIRKLTLDLGLRYDSFSAVANAQTLGAGYWVPERSFPDVRDVPNWKNLNPRLGVSYDLFGNGRTAVKASFGRYVTGTSSKGNNGMAISQPILNQSTNATRTWNDANGNYIPDCVLGPEVPGANGECGPLSDQNFGRLIEGPPGQAGNLLFGDEVLHGFQDAQPFYWQGSVSLDHEIRPGMGVAVNYNRTVFGNFTVTDNLQVTPADFDEFCITAPVDDRLPGDGGTQICGLYDVKPEKFGQVNNLVSMAEPGNGPLQVFNGVDVIARIRFGGGVQFQGGVSAGRSVTDNCFVVDSPQQLYECRVSPPWSAGTRLKFLVVYPLPWRFRASSIYQNLPGIARQATLSVRNAQIVPSLGRNLASCRGAAVCTDTVRVDLIQPETMFEDRSHELDFRLSRIFRVGRNSLEANVDVFNLLNQNDVIDMNTTYGTSWLNATQILAGRLVKVGALLRF